ncbi:MAG: hypothetical protein ACRCX8_05755 [Sarcina sp.]
MDNRIHSLAKRAVMQNGASMQLFVVLEEICELLEANTSDEQIEELADVRVGIAILEVVYGISKEEIRGCYDDYGIKSLDDIYLSEWLLPLHKTITKTIRGKVARIELVKEVHKALYIISLVTSDKVLGKDYKNILRAKLDRLEDRLNKGER